MIFEKDYDRIVLRDMSSGKIVGMVEGIELSNERFDSTLEALNALLDCLSK